MVRGKKGRKEEKEGGRMEVRERMGLELVLCDHSM